MPELLRLAVEGRVATLTLDSPPVNAIGSAMLADLEGALGWIEASGAVSVLRIRSAGRMFSAGADLKEIGGWAGSETGPAEMGAWLERLHGAFDRLAVRLRHRRRFVREVKELSADGDMPLEIRGRRGRLPRMDDRSISIDHADVHLLYRDSQASEKLHDRVSSSNSGADPSDLCGRAAAIAQC